MCECALGFISDVWETSWLCPFFTRSRTSDMPIAAAERANKRLAHCNMFSAKERPRWTRVYHQMSMRRERKKKIAMTAVAVTSEKKGTCWHIGSP
jgi:hypothetical protein